MKNSILGVVRLNIEGGYQKSSENLERESLNFNEGIV